MKRIGTRIKLGVNIDHVASLRQARGTAYPDVVAAARICEEAGAEGITIHLREDRRHIQDRDVYALRKTIRTRMNLEMANSPEIVDIALDVHPDEVCVVPERRQELTTEGGLDCVRHMKSLKKTVASLRDAGIVVSLFIEPSSRQIDAAAELGATCVELHTGRYCDTKGAVARSELKRLVQAARQAHSLGITVNAGHGISLDNVAGILVMPHLDTLNIGHSIVCHSVFVGLHAAVRAMLKGMSAYAGGGK